jgi:hypothetical protein
MQRKDGDPSKNYTADEFDSAMERVREKVRALQTQHPRFFPGGVKFVMDKAKQHGRFTKALGDRAIPHPPLSFEFNKVVEHLFNTIKYELKKRLSALLVTRGVSHKLVPFKETKKIMVEVMNTVVRVESLIKDASTMRDTYRAVIAAGGGRVAKELS